MLMFAEQETAHQKPSIVSDFRKSTTQVVFDVSFSSIPREKEEAFAKLRPTSRSPLEHQSYLYCPSLTEMFET